MASPNTKRNNDAETNDLYTTPLDALNALWENAPYVLRHAKRVVDNSFGLGDITRFFKDKGMLVEGYDLHNYGDEFANGLDEVSYGDFLEQEIAKYDRNTVMVFNPPFTLTYEFVNKSLELCDNLFMFNRLNTLETLKRAKMFKTKQWPLKKVYIFGGRVSCPRGVEYEPSANATAYAWFEFEVGYEGEPTLCWI